MVTTVATPVLALACSPPRPSAVASLVVAATLAVATLPARRAARLPAATILRTE